MRFTITPENEPSIVINDDKSEIVRWYLLDNGLESWFSTTSPKEELHMHPTLDGGVKPSKLTQESKSFALHIGYKFESSLYASHAIDEINGLFGKDLVFRCEDALGVREANGYMSASPDIQLLYDEQTVIADVIFTCPDPHKYDLPYKYEVDGSSITVNNRGNCDTWPTVEVSGPVTNLTLTLNGQTVRWSGSANKLTIDFRTGESSSGTLSVDNAFPIPPGTHKISVISDGEVSMTVRSAWR